MSVMDVPLRMSSVGLLFEISASFAPLCVRRRVVESEADRWISSNLRMVVNNARGEQLIDGCLLLRRQN